MTQGLFASHFRRVASTALIALVTWLGVTAGAAAVAGARTIPEGATRTIPEGAALWYACTQPDFSGVKPLDCPEPYDPQYLSTFLSGFTRFTPENEFQMQYLEPQQDRFDFTLADEIARFAISHRLTIRGHSLLWWGEEPFWLTHPLLPWSYSSLSTVMRDYITTVVSHFATEFPGTVPEWDVINEPLDAYGHYIPTVWERVLGPNYIPTALEEAHAADPTANLVINDESSGAPGPEQTALLNLATQLVNQDVPLNTVGFEAHVNPETAATIPQLLSLWRSYAGIGLKVEVTELDVSDYDGIDDPAAKAAVFERYAEACREAPNCTGYSVWGVADQYSWLGANTDALLYNAAFQPTAAVSVVQKDLEGVVSAVHKTTAKRRKRAAKAKAKHRKPST